LKQFPYPQKKMFPPSLRKDYWTPLVHAIFPNHLIANHIYKRLLDHRAWRLTAPPSVDQLNIPKKRRNQLALNQVPTSIADLAHVTKDIQGKMIMNWHRFEERDWAREWSENIWHCPQGFALERGYRLEQYTFPQIDEDVRKQMGWEEDPESEPPRNLEEARDQNKTIWQRMHAKWLSRSMAAREARAKKAQENQEEQSGKTV
jgi:hypothetical protein